MATIVKVGDVFPAKPEPKGITNPGPIQDADGNGLDPWLLIKAQDKAYTQNLVLIEEHQAQVQASPAYGEELGNKPSWAVYTAAAEAGGLDFQQQRLGPPVRTLTDPNAPQPKA